MRWNRTKKIFVVTFALILLAGLVYGGKWYLIGRKCNRRAEEFQRKVETLRKQAKADLPVGAKREAVVRFFEMHGMGLTEEAPELDKSPHPIEGTLHFSGDKECGSLVCGDDRSAIVLQVGVDEHGTVIVEPDVQGIYTNCL
jgi:hypothetical protein